jgi:hypothetical protein
MAYYRIIRNVAMEILYQAMDVLIHALYKTAILATQTAPSCSQKQNNQ